MKRLNILVSMLVLGSLVLAACGTSDTNSNSNTLGTKVPGAIATSTMAVSSGDLATATLPADLATAAPLAATATEAVVAPAATATEAVVAPVATATVAAAVGDTTQTPMAGTSEMLPLTTPYRLSMVTDKDVKTQDGEDLGQIDRLVINTDGTIRYAVLKTGDFLGMGGKSLLIPWQAFKPFTIQKEALSADAMVLSTNKEALTAAPTLEGDNFDYTAADWDKAVTAYWSSQNMTVPVTGTGAAATPIVIKGDLGDVKAINAQGNDLGEISDFIIDPESGKIGYGIFNMGGFLGVGERYIPVPWTSIKWAPESKAVLNIDKASLSTAPYFDKWDNLDLTAANFSTEWNTFWGKYKVTP